MKKAVILLSGGLDSATTLAIAKSENHELSAVSFDYGQRHSCELRCAKRIAEHYDVKDHKIITIDLRTIGGSALTDDNIAVPEARDLECISKNIPTTYVPARNTIFLSYALAYAEVLDAESIFIGANARDYSGYPDCRPEYYTAFQELARLGTKRGIEGEPIEIRYPLIDMTKSEIIQKGLELGVPYELTWSCYKGGDKPCDKCDSCILRAKGFREAGVEDPAMEIETMD